jgi:hypothetical protein
VALRVIVVQNTDNSTLVEVSLHFENWDTAKPAHMVHRFPYLGGNLKHFGIKSKINGRKRKIHFDSIQSIVAYGG